MKSSSLNSPLHVALHIARQLSLRPRTPPKVLPRHTRPVTSWNGRVLISWPAPANDDDGFAPALCGRHSSAARASPDVADALEGEVDAAVGHLDDHLLNGFVERVRVDAVGGAQLCGPASNLLSLMSMAMMRSALAGARLP